LGSNDLLAPWSCSLYIWNIIILHITMKATKKEINMPVDIELQRRIVKYLCWGIPQLVFWGILFINFLFYVIRGN